MWLTPASALFLACLSPGLSFRSSCPTWIPSPAIIIHAPAYTGGSSGRSTFVTFGDVLQALCENRQHLAIGYKGQGEEGVTRQVPNGIPGASEDASVGVGYPVQRVGDSKDRKMMFAGLLPPSLGAEVYTLHIIA